MEGSNRNKEENLHQELTARIDWAPTPFKNVSRGLAVVQIFKESAQTFLAMLLIYIKVEFRIFLMI
jgi:hypothetical protein